MILRRPRAIARSLARGRLLRLWVGAASRGVAVALGVALIGFALIRITPGDPAVILLGDQATPEQIHRLRERLNLDGTVPEQLATYASALVRGDLGTSLVSGQPVTAIVAASLPATLGLLALAFLFAVAIAVPLGLGVGMSRGRLVPQVFRAVASACVALPVFFTGVVAILVFSVWLRVAPVGGLSGGFPEAVRYLWAPALVLALVLGPLLARVLEASVRRTAAEEFVETAMTLGLGRRRLVTAYVLRPSLAPTVALLGYLVGTQLGAAVIVEYVFNIPGIGTALVSAVATRDYPSVQGIVFVFGLIVVIANTLAAMVSGWLDPRTADRQDA